MDQRRRPVNCVSSERGEIFEGLGVPVQGKNLNSCHQVGPWLYENVFLNCSRHGKYLSFYM